MQERNHLILLLSMIRGYCCQFDALNNEYVAIVAAIKNLLYFFKKATQTNSDYQEDFLAMVEVIEEYGVRWSRIAHLFSQHDQKGINCGEGCK